MKKVGIIGNGFVGSAIAAGFALHADIMIYDKDPRRSVDPLEDLINKCEFIFVGVPTPMESTTDGTISLDILDSVMEEISSLNRRRDNIFILKSTIVPGTTQQYIERYPNLNIVFIS